MKNLPLNNQLSFEKQKELLIPYLESQIPFILNNEIVTIQNFCEYEINSDFMDKYFIECVLKSVLTNNYLDDTVPIIEVFKICYPHLV